MSHHHDHDHHHEGHHHHHHVHAASMGGSMDWIFLFCILLNVAFVAIEAFIGWRVDSMSLLSDAGHNLSDVFSLVLVLLGFHLARVASDHKYTYGLKKSTVLISLVNALLLLVALVFIWMESIDKLSHPVSVDGAAISWTAFAGIVINGLTTVLLMRGQKDDLNVRGAYLHMLADTLVSVGVVVSGVLILLTGWSIVDPIVSLLITFPIIRSSWGLLRESLRMTLDGTPENVEVDRLVELMLADERVSEVHHVHVWAISTTENALTAHVVIGNLNEMESVKHALKHALGEAGIGHATLEFETADSQCEESVCK
ncbi:MAG: cation transporter [Prevotella sp.]|nr:cation transporter [Prevotella sp.]